MIKGTKKAILRTPHRLVGSKSIEDRVIVEWTKDFHTADDALKLIISEARTFRDAWKTMLESEQAFVQILGQELYMPIVEENVYRAVQETPKSATSAVEQLTQTFQEIHHETMPIIETLEGAVIAKCSGARDCVEAVSKALKKREHKKVDFDRFTNSAEKLYKKQVNSGGAGASDPASKEALSMSKAQKEVDDAMETFYALDEKIKRVVPYMLQCISEFLNPLTATLYLTQLRVLDVFRTHLLSYCQTQGFVDRNGQPYEWDDICDQWQQQFLKVQSRAEQGLTTLRNGNTVKKAITQDTSKTRARDVLKNATVASTKTLKNVVVRPKPVQFSSQALGMFRSEADLLAMGPISPGRSMSGSMAGSMPGSPETGSGLMPFPSFQSHANHSREASRQTSISQHSASSVHSFSPPPPFSPPTIAAHSLNPLDLATRTRVRAFSSASAKAMSPHLSSFDGKTHEFAVSMYTFVGGEPGDVSFRQGERIRVLDHGDESDNMWWFGETVDGRLGLFPANYVQLE